MKRIIQQLRSQCFNAKVLPNETLDWIKENNLWNLWVPKEFGGLENTFSQGLKKLQSLAQIDGSLGWTVTLCSGANYFIGNLKKETAKAIFTSKGTCLGGSGGVFGIAEKIVHDYKVSGQWHYATGAPYLTHFTLNAKIIENGKVLKNKDGNPTIRSFILPREKVKIIEDWNTMGLIATATHSFDVPEVLVNEKYSFTYNKAFINQVIFKIPFVVFADLTLWVNYIGMGEHFLEEAEVFLNQKSLSLLAELLQNSNYQIYSFAQEVESKIKNNSSVAEELVFNIHQTASKSVRELAAAIISVYPFLGIKASRKSHQLNQIFRDYFTATQHHNFVERKSESL